MVHKKTMLQLLLSMSRTGKPGFSYNHPFEHQSWDRLNKAPAKYRWNKNVTAFTIGMWRSKWLHSNTSKMDILSILSKGWRFTSSDPDTSTSNFFRCDPAPTFRRTYGSSNSHSASRTILAYYHDRPMVKSEY